MGIRCGNYRTQNCVKKSAEVTLDTLHNGSRAFLTTGLFKFTQLYLNNRDMFQLPFVVGNAVVSPVTGAMVVASVVHTAFEHIMKDPESDSLTLKQKLFRYGPEAVIVSALAVPFGIEGVAAYGLYRGVGACIDKVQKYAQMTFIEPPTMLVNSSRKPATADDIAAVGASPTGESAKAPAQKGRPWLNWGRQKTPAKKEQGS